MRKRFAFVAGNDESSVARMSEAISGSRRHVPGCRVAHPGYNVSPRGFYLLSQTLTSRISFKIRASLGGAESPNGSEQGIPKSAACGPPLRRAYRAQRSCGRVAEGGGLLNRYRVVKPYRGFESLRLRHPSPCGLRVAGHPKTAGRRVSPEAPRERRETVAACGTSIFSN